MKVFKRTAIFITTLIVVLTASRSKLFGQAGFISEQSLSSKFDYTIQFWNSENGLPQNSINSCIQTQDGYLWMATANGLVRFDGAVFKVYNTQNTPGLPDNYFLKLFEDSQHNLWLITSTYQLVKYAKGAFQKQFLENNKSKMVTAIAENDSKELILSFANGNICAFNGHQLTVVLRTHEKMIKSLIYHQGIYYTTSKGIFLYRNYEISLVKSIRSTGNFSFKKGPNETLWAFCNKDLYKISDTEAKIFVLPMETKDQIQITDVLIEKDSKVWLSSENGIYIVDSIDYKHYAINSGLPSNATTILFKDRESNIWVGTNNSGICKMKLKTIKTYSRDDGLRDDVCGPVISYKNGSVLLSNFCNGITQWQNGKFSSFNDTHLGCVWSMLYDIDQNLFAGTYSKDLYLYKEHNPKKILSAGKSISEVYLALFRDKQNTLWIGTKKGLFYTRDSVFIQFEPNEIDYAVTYIMQDSQGRIMFCSENGLGVIENGKLKLYSIKEGLSHNKTRHIYEDREGTYWISTYGGGLNRLKGNTFFAYNNNGEIIDNSTSCLVDDQHGKFWISTNHGIYSIAKSNLNEYADNKTPFLNVSHYGREDGMKNSECNGGFQGAGLRTSGGKILFPTAGGLAIIDSMNERQEKKQFDIFMESVVLDHNTFSNIDSIAEISRGTQKIEFNFTSPYLGDNYNLLFQHQLEGLEEDWSKPDDKRTVNYLNLPPGNYTLKLRVYGNLKELRFKFSIPPPIWKTKLFYFLVCGICFCAGLVILWLRTNMIRKREEEKVKINKQYAALELKTLQGQMNPHFLFNCLNTIKYFIATDDKISAGKYLGKFSKMIRLFLEHSNSNSITLENEINLLTHYIEMEQLRLDNGFTFIPQIENGLPLNEIEMPAMILQPFIENAIHHGLKNLNTHGTLTLSFSIENRFLKIVVEDNGVGRMKASELKLLSPKEHKSMGIQLITERIQILNYIKNTSISVDVKDKVATGIQNNGTCVTVKIPLSYN